MCTLRKIIRIFGFFLILIATITGLVFGYTARLKQNLPNVERFISFPSLETSDIFDRTGQRIGCVATEGHYTLPTEKIISMRIARFIVAKEDHRYWERKQNFGNLSFILDFHSILRAAFENYYAGKVVQGASTIPQQLAKQILNPSERSKRNLERKIKEVLLAQQLVSKYDKKQILALYLNILPLGDNRYGVQAASIHYFNKDAENLSVREMAIIAGIIKAPAKYSPKKHPKRAKQQLNEALIRARNAGVISKEEYAAAYMNPDENSPLPLSDAYDNSCATYPFAVRATLDQMRDKLGLYFDAEQMQTTWTGIKIYTTIDATIQKYAEESLARAIQDYKTRLGARALDANGAMVVIDNATGKIIAVAGGVDYAKNKFNVALDGERQAGSTIKPIVYASYFEKLMSQGIAADKLLDQPISNARFSCVGATRGQRWSPKNFDERKFSAGSYTIRKAIEQSINRCALHAASHPDKPCALDFRVVLMARKLGISSKNLLVLDSAIRARLPIAIGGLDVIPFELARAYSVFPNKGILRQYSRTYLIDHITDANGNTLYHEHSYTETQVIPPEIAHTMVRALRNVVLSGTARSSLGKIAQPVAGKTGTTNDYTDAWFCGFSPHITACVWVGGKDKTQSLGDRETGGKVSAPAFKYFIERYYEGRSPVPFFEETSDAIY